MDADELAFQNKYSRQIATMGLAAVRKLVKARILIVGCGSTGSETAKNVILQGSRAVTLHDPVSSPQRSLFRRRGRGCQREPKRAESSRIFLMSPVSPTRAVKLFFIDAGITRHKRRCPSLNKRGC